MHKGDTTFQTTLLSQLPRGAAVRNHSNGNALSSQCLLTLRLAESLSQSGKTGYHKIQPNHDTEVLSACISLLPTSKSHVPCCTLSGINLEYDNHIYIHFKAFLFCFNVYFECMHACIHVLSWDGMYVEGRGKIWEVVSFTMWKPAQVGTCPCPLSHLIYPVILTKKVH